jgi:hypothetical protein
VRLDGCRARNDTLRAPFSALDGTAPKVRSSISDAPSETAPVSTFPALSPPLITRCPPAWRDATIESAPMREERRSGLAD